VEEEQPVNCAVDRRAATHNFRHSPHLGLWKLWMLGWFNADVRRLWPDPVDSVAVSEQYGSPARPRPAERPWLGVCMVASIDGATVVEGRSGALSSPTDQSVLLALRQAADVVLVGAGTVRAEGYGPPKKPGLRVGVVTARGDVDPDAELFRSGAGFLITNETAPDHGIEAVRAGRKDVDLRAALGKLDARLVQAEGGPRLNASLLEADLVDEVNLTVSPLLVGSDAPRIVQGQEAMLRRMRLAHVCEDDGFMFLRYVRETGS